MENRKAAFFLTV